MNEKLNMESLEKVKGGYNVKPETKKSDFKGGQELTGFKFSSEISEYILGGVSHKDVANQMNTIIISFYGSEGIVTNQLAKLTSYLENKLANDGDFFKKDHTIELSKLKEELKIIT